jgi:hypothetical protein
MNPRFFLGLASRRSIQRNYVGLRIAGHGAGPVLVGEIR